MSIVIKLTSKCSHCCHGTEEEPCMAGGQVQGVQEGAPQGESMKQTHYCNAHPADREGGVACECYYGDGEEEESRTTQG